jgi:hypothetical protein
MVVGYQAISSLARQDYWFELDVTCQLAVYNLGSVIHDSVIKAIMSKISGINKSTEG